MILACIPGCDLLFALGIVALIAVVGGAGKEDAQKDGAKTKTGPSPDPNPAKEAAGQATTDARPDVVT